MIGANAAGAKAAAKAKRVAPEAEIVLIDRAAIASYGPCGIPYFIGGDVADIQELVRTPFGMTRDNHFFEALKGVTLLTDNEVVDIDRMTRQVKIHAKKDGFTGIIEYDRLILATGSTPAIPPVENMGCPNILTVRTLQDAETIKSKAQPGNAVCIVGGGLIGLEMTEALSKRGMSVSLIELRQQLLPELIDPEMALHVENYLAAQGINIFTSCTVLGFDGSTRVERAITDRGDVPADLVILAPGVVPNTMLAELAGIELGKTGAILVDDRMCTSDPFIFACGDCCESREQVSGRTIHNPMGSTAAKQGRVAGINAAGGNARFEGVLGTTIIQAFGLNIGKSGLTETEARALSFDTETVLVPGFDRAHFYPDSKRILIKLIADKADGRVLGVQALGMGNVDKRIDAAAVAMTYGATVTKLAQIDLGYSPPYAPPTDILAVACDVMQNKLNGDARGIGPLALLNMHKQGIFPFLLDVRETEEMSGSMLPGTCFLPLSMLPNRLHELPQDQQIVTICKTGIRGYAAQRVLRSAGFSQAMFLDGGLECWPYGLEEIKG